MGACRIQSLVGFGWYKDPGKDKSRWAQAFYI